MRTPRHQDGAEDHPVPGRPAARRAAALAAALALLSAPGLLTSQVTAGATEQDPEPPDAAGAAAPVTALLELDAAPSWTAWLGAEQQARRARRAAPEVRRLARAAGASQRAAVSGAADRLERALHRRAPGVQVLYRTESVLSAVAVRAPAGELPALRRLPGVRAVHPVGLKHPDNSFSVPLTGAPTAWAGAAGLPGDTGQGVTIGVIDSGIDYTHADFGGPGTPEAYKSVDGSRPAPPGLFPNAKVVGGWDFVGDDYDPDPASPAYQPVAHPDANPLDCAENGHGTHVAGTAAGDGVTRDGRTYTGPYGPALDPAAFRVGPGVAPGARLYALRVFGCHGTTDAISQALDRAADPNQDGDFSDRLDVVNLSLGGPYGDPDDGDALAADRLAATGTVVVASAGNDGDVYGIGSSPSIAARAIAVAASVDSHTDADGIRLLSPPVPPGSWSLLLPPGATAPLPAAGQGTPGPPPAPGPAPTAKPAETPARPARAVPSDPPSPQPAPGSPGAPAPTPGAPTAPAPTPSPGIPVPGAPAPTPTPAPGAPVPGAPVPAQPGGPAPAGVVVPARWSSRYAGWETRDVNGELALPGAADADGCAAFGTEDAARLRGRIALLSWATKDSDRACGSAARADHAADAGAIGVVLAADGDQVGEIAGDDRIPAAIVARADGERLRALAAAQPPVPVQLAVPGNDLRGSVSQDQPERTDTLAGFSSRGQGLPGLVKPDVSGPGETILSAEAGSGAAGVRKDGTSMAAPHIAGAAALVRAARRAWTPAQVKAALMNTATADLTTGDRHTGRVYGPERVGAGRVRADLAVRTPAVAYAAGRGAPDGAVGVSFGAVAVNAPVALTREVEVRNLGDRPLAYRTGYQAATTVSGADYSVSPAEVTVPAGGAARVRVTLRVPVPAALGWDPDPTLALEQAGHRRAFRPEASGRLVLTPAEDGLPQLRVPVFAAVRAASRFDGAPVAWLPADRWGRPGTVVAIGGLPALGRAVPDASGLLSAFVLGGDGRRWPDCAEQAEGAQGAEPPVDCALAPHDRVANLRLAGAASDAPAVAAAGGDPVADGRLYLAATSWAPAATPVGTTAVRASLDTDGDGRTDAVVAADRLPGSDVLVARTLDARTGRQLDVEPLGGRWGDTDTGLLDSDTVVLPVRLSALPGLRRGSFRIHYALWTGWTAPAALPDARRALDSIGLAEDGPVLPLDVLWPALDIRAGVARPGGAAPAAVDVPEGPGTLLEVRRDLLTYGALGSPGLLLVHHRNEGGLRAQEVPLP